MSTYSRSRWLRSQCICRDNVTVYIPEYLTSSAHKDWTPIDCLIVILNIETFKHEWLEDNFEHKKLQQGSKTNAK